MTFFILNHIKMIYFLLKTNGKDLNETKISMEDVQLIQKKILFSEQMSTRFKWTFCLCGMDIVTCKAVSETRASYGPGPAARQAKVQAQF